MIPDVCVLVLALTSATTDDDALVTSDCVASEPEVKPAPVSVRVPLVQTSAASVPKLESVLDVYDQTLAGTAAIDAASEVDAVRTCVFVLAFTRATTDDEAFPTVVSVWALTALVIPAVAVSVCAFTFEVSAVIAAPRDEEAVWTSDCVASEPVLKLAPVSVLVPELHTSEARVPKLESVLVPAAQTLAGIEVIEDAIEVSDAPIDDDAVVTMLLVFAFTTAAIEDDAMSVCAFTPVVTPAVAELVLAFTSATTEDDAVCTSDCVASDPALRPAPVSVRVAEDQTSVASVPNEESVREEYAQTFAGIEVIEAASDVEAAFVLALTTAATDEVAVASEVSVCALTLDVTPAVAVSVWALTFDVSAVIAVPSEVEAVFTSDWVASDPELRLAPVRVRVPLVQTSAASVPKLESVLVPAAQTLVGIDVMDAAIEVSDAPMDDDAVVTTLVVLAFTTAAIEDDAVSVCAFTAVVTAAVCVLVFPFTTAATDDEALCTSESVASEPELKLAPVRVRVA